MCEMQTKMLGPGRVCIVQFDRAFKSSMLCVCLGEEVLQDPPALSGFLGATVHCNIVLVRLICGMACLPALPLRARALAARSFGPTLLRSSRCPGTFCRAADAHAAHSFQKAVMAGMIDGCNQRLSLPILVLSSAF